TGAFLRRRARGSPRAAARGRAVPCRRELSVERARPPCTRGGRRACAALDLRTVGAARRKTLSDGRQTMRNGCHRVWRPGRDFDAVLLLVLEEQGRRISKSRRLCRPDDAAILPGVRVAARTRGGVRSVARGMG